MKSAYAVLGVPGNASPEDIEAAFRRGRETYPPQRLAQEDGAVDRFNELKQAYDILRDPQARAAHDRKLVRAVVQKPAPRRVETVYVEESPARKLLVWGMVLAAVIFAGAFYVHQRTLQQRAAQDALELANKQREEREAQEKKAATVRVEQERAAAQAKQEADERRFAMESRAAAQRASWERAQQDARAAQMQRSAALEQQRQEAAALLQESRAAAEARLRVEKDKRRIRELCIQLYQRADC